MFELLENTSFEELRQDNALLSEVIARSASVKASVVAEDEREGGRRRILNLGHTIAHAIEKSTSKLSHGEAVAVGLYHIIRYAVKEGILSQNDASRIFGLLEKYGFETELPAERNQLLNAVCGDKKRSGDTLHIIIPTSIGSVEDRVLRLDEISVIL